MFTLEQIKEAHSKVKSGAEFPAYIQELIKLGVKSYDVSVSDGQTAYYGANNYNINSMAKYDAMSIAEVANVNIFKQKLKDHQCGKTDYLTFCRDAASCGVYKWVIDTNKLTCTYYDIFDNTLLTEQIPASLG